MRTALAEMGHLQPPTPVSMDNTAGNSIVNWKAKQKSRAIYMRFFGSETESDKTIYTYSMNRERKTWQTMSQKTT